MRTLSAALIAQQTKTHGVPAAQVVIDDRFVGVFRPRWSILRNNAATLPAGPVALAATYSGAFIYARTNPATGILYTDTIAAADVATAAAWDSWTQRATGVSPTSQIAIAFDGNTIQALFYVLSDLRTIKVIQSSDNGTTWSAAVTVTTLAAGHECHSLAATLNAGSGTLYCFYADENRTGDGSIAPTTIYSASRAETGGAWSTPATWGRPAANGAHGLAVNGTGTSFNVVFCAPTAMRSYVVPLANLAAWPAPTERLKADNPAVTYRWPHIALAFDQHFAVFAVEHNTSTATDRPVSLFSPDFDVFSILKRPYNIATAYGMAASADLTYHYLVTAQQVYRSTRWAPNTAALRITMQDDVLRLNVSEHTAAPGRLDLTLRNDDGRYATDLTAGSYCALRRGSQVSARIGYTIQGTDDLSYFRPYWITVLSHDRRKSSSTIEISAIDGWGVLTAIEAPQLYTWTASTILTMLTNILAGLGFSVENDANAAWSTVIATFSVTPGTLLITAVLRLLTLAGGQLLFRSDPTWEAQWPSAIAYLRIISATSQYTIGTTHPIVNAIYKSALPSATHTTTLGADLIRGDAIDYDLVDTLGADLVDTHVERRLTTNAQAAADAATRLADITQDANADTVTMPPHVGLEIGDTIHVADTLIGLSVDRSVMSSELTLDRQRGVWQQILKLGAPPS